MVNLVFYYKVFVFYTIVGETPESIYCSEVDINNGWKLENTEMLLKPSYPYEGSNYPLAPSKFGSAIGVNELRDPCVFDDGGEIYLLYTVMGEVSITMAKLHRINSETKKYHIWGMRRSGNHAITEWISFLSTFHCGQSSEASSVIFLIIYCLNLLVEI